MVGRSMATVKCYIAAPPSAVFAVLADGWGYCSWVVGASHMRAVDASWPEQGSRLHHATGAWPLLVKDETVVEGVEPGRSITLLARGRPLGEARVIIEVQPEGAGSRVIMHETPVSGAGRT